MFKYKKRISKDSLENRDLRHFVRTPKIQVPFRVQLT